MRAAALLFGLALAALAGAEALQPIPPVARVTDQTGTLAPAQLRALEAKLAAFEAEKGSQIAVLMVPTTAPEDIAGYGIRVARAWQLGRKDVQDGALVIVAKGDRHARIEVGYGLEGPVPDAYAVRIVDDVMAPYFKQGDFYRGLDAGLTQLIGLVNGEPLPPPRAQRHRGGGPLQGSLFLVLIGALVLGAVLRAMFGRVFGALATGGIVGAATWLIVVSLGGALVAGFAAFFIALVGDLGRRGIGGFGGIGGGFGGGGFGGGLGGGGGFSGGGGGFGGGGASGSW